MYIDTPGRIPSMAPGRPLVDGRPNRKNQNIVKAHQYVAREGEVQSHLHFVMEGWACRYTLLPDGRRQITSLFLPGDYCELKWVHSGTAGQHIVALTNMRTMRIMCRSVIELAEQHSSIRNLLWADALSCAALQNEWILNLGRKNALEKISHLFCEIYHRLKRRGLTYGDQCAMPLTQLDLADITGLTPVHVNRTLQEMRTLGLVELRSKWLRLPDMARLRQIAIFDDNYLREEKERDSHAVLSLLHEPLLVAC